MNIFYISIFLLFIKIVLNMLFIKLCFKEVGKGRLLINIDIYE